MGTITIRTDDLANALGHVVHAASRDEARPILNGVCFDAHPLGKGLRIVAADNYRIRHEKTRRSEL